MKTILNRWLPPVLMMGIIFWWSTRSVLPGSGITLLWWDYIIKKTAHLVEYGLLFFCWQRALNWHKSENEFDYRISLLIVFLYALTDELHQSFTPGRHANLNDVGFDLLGGYLVYIRMVGAI